MNAPIKLAAVIAAAMLLVLAVLAAYAGVVWSAMDAAHRELTAAVLGEYSGSLVLLLAMLALALGLALTPLYRAYALEPLRLAQSTRLVATANPALRLPAGAAAEIAELGDAVNLLAARYEAALLAANTRIEEARGEAAHEKKRLAALVEELAHPVIVCNADGAVLLYNRAARALFARPGNAIESTLLGLGRSVFSLIDRTLVAHSLERLQVGMRRAGHAVVHFVTTAPSGEAVRTELAPIAGSDGRLEGYILTFAQAQGALDLAERREALLHSLAEGGRAALANVLTAAEAMHQAAALDEATRLGFLRVIREETEGYARRLDEAARRAADDSRAQWALEELPCTDLAAMAREHLGGKLHVDEDPHAGEAWVRVDSYVMLHVLAALARLLPPAHGRVRFMRITATERHAQIDIGARPAGAGDGEAGDWEEVRLAAHGALAHRTVRQALERHGAEAWQQHDMAAGERYFRLLLPRAPAPAADAVPARLLESRPEFYDFDLFHRTGQSAALEHRRLTELAYTVFDTETTGLQPSQGDEIVSIGAVRIVNGRLLPHEAFEQLVDPGRPLSPSSARITGIDPAMLAGQPTIAEVLPLFHRYCEDTVLVAHNAAFDMRFLQIKESATEVRFAQPVLDTLLLSAVLHPAHESHQLEAIAERHGVSIVGRHTALGDAMVTAEIFLRMIPQLAERGIVTLADAQQAARRTYYARVTY